MTASAWVAGKREEVGPEVGFANAVDRILQARACRGHGGGEDSGDDETASGHARDCALNRAAYRKR